MVNVRLAFKNGAVCDITASRVTQEEIRKIRIFQEDSYILLDLLYHDAYIFRKKGGRIVRDRLRIKRREPLKVELKSFINSIQTSSRPVVSGREGRKALSVALAILDKIK